ncbi:MAG: YVTN family beta-propeller repeat protein [Aggregatilineales bacterium]
MNNCTARFSFVSIGRRALLIAFVALFAGLLVHQSAAQSAAPKAYVGVFKDNTVAVIDTSTNQVLKTIPVPTGPHGLAVTPDGHFVYVSSDGDTKVSVIDTSTDTIVNTIEVGKSPNGLTLTPDGKQLLVAVFGAGQIVFIDTSTNKILGQVAVPSPHNTAVSPDGKTVYVGTNYAADPNTPTTLTILDLASRTQTGTVVLPPIAQTVRTLNFSPDGKALYFTQTGVDSVQVLDPTTNKITTQIAVGAAPHHVLFTPSGEYLLVVSQTTNELSLIDPKTNTITAKIPVGKKPHWIALTDGGNVAYVTNESGNTVSVVDLETQKVTATISVGNTPRKIVIQPSIANMSATAGATMAATMASN